MGFARTSHTKVPPRSLVTLVTDEIRARANSVFPELFEGGCGLRSIAALQWPVAHTLAVPKISTTVREKHNRCIRTTVAERQRCHGSWPQSGATGRCSKDVAAAAHSFVSCPSDVTMRGDCSVDSLAIVPANKIEEITTAERIKLLAKQGLLGFAPFFIAAPLQLLSPWASLGGGVSMAMMAPPPPGFQRGAMGIPGMPKEEEQFMELIFPGWDAGAFVWQITCWQVMEFAISMALGHQKANPTPCVLYRLGASWGPAVARGEVWRLITPVFLHANLTHLLFNVFFQLRMGFGMEKQFGREKMMLIYFVCGMFGNLMSISVDPFKLAVGASTAGFGLIGVWLAEILLSWEILGPARERTIIWIVFMLVSVTTMSTMTPNMDIWGHLGGALGGFLLSIVISDMKEEDRPEWYSQVRTVAAVALALIVTGALSKTFIIGPRTPIPECPLFPGLENLLPGSLQAAFPKVMAAAATQH